MEIVALRGHEPLGWPSPAVAIGNFDGVHRGHQELARTVVSDARAGGGTAVVLSFDPHPARVLQPERAPRALMSFGQRAELLSELGIDRLAVLPFDAGMAAMSAEAFARDVLAERLRARLVVVGERFRFGRGRSGDVPLLSRLGPSLGFRVHAVPALLDDGRPVSSSRVRQALGAGDVGLAQRLLGRAFFVDGRVVRGDGRGRRLGIPTANLALENECVPAGGVYAGFASVDREPARHACVLNIGSRPTFGAGPLSIEAHLLDFDGALYERGLRVRFAARLREERRFESAAQLVDQIQRDVARARAILEDGSAKAV